MIHKIIGSNRKLEGLLYSGGVPAEELLKRIETLENPESPIETPVVETKQKQSYEGLLPSDATETPYGSLTKTVEFYGHELVESDANVMNEFFKAYPKNNSIERYLYWEWIEIGNKRFVKINFSEENLSEFFDGLGYLTGLKFINFGGNFLSALPKSVGNWRDLEIVSFYNNSLSILPDSFGNWGKLKLGDFTENPLNNDSKKILDKLKKSTGAIINY